MKEGDSKLRRECVAVRMNKASQQPLDVRWSEEVRREVEARC